MKKFNEFLDEAKDDGEYGQQGGMAKSQLRMIMSAAKRLHDSLKDDDVLPGHIIANIVLASDYVTGSADYMESEMNDEYDDDEMDDMDEEVELDEISTEKLRDYASKALQDKNKTKSDKRWKYGSKATDIVGDRDTKAAHDLKFNKTEEVKLDEEEKPAYHYYATKNGIGAKEMKLTHSKSKPFTSETDALNHIVKTGGRKDGIIHKVNSATGKVVQHRGIDGGQKGYPTPASDMASDAPKHVRDLKEDAKLDEAGRHVDYVPRKSSNTEVDVKGTKVPIKKHSWGDWEVPYGPHKDIGQHKSKESLVNALHTRIKEEVELDEGVKEKISGIIRREKQKEYPLLQNRRDVAATKAGSAYAVGDHKKGDRYMKWRDDNMKKEEVELDEASDLRITKVYNKFPKKASYAVHSADRKYYKEFDNEAAAKAHHAEKTGK